MTWQDRLREAAYTAPSGTRIVFTYEDVSTSVDKLTAAFNFPDGDGTFVQDLGRTGRRFPLRVIFWGDSHDLQAEEFEQLLLERGRGTLEHPAFGRHQVVPFGVIDRSNRLRTAANQTIIEVTFWESTAAVYPVSDDAPLENLEAQVEETNEAAAEEVEERIETESAVEETSLREQITAQARRIKSALDAVSDRVDQVQREVNATLNSIVSGVDTLIGTPATLAFQVMNLAQAPARALSLFEDKLDAYTNLIESVVGFNTDGPGFDGTASNDFLTNDLSAQAALSGRCLGVTASTFPTQSDAISAADGIADLLDTVTDWREGQFDNLEQVDTGTAYQAIQTLVATTLAALVELGLQLPREKIVTLTRARNPIELVAELYGEVDGRLDEFIQQNSLTGLELLEVPAGRQVVYYV